MSATPRRVSGAYPATPGTTRRGAPLTPSPTPDPTPARSSRGSTGRSPLPLAPQNASVAPSGSQPFIPVTILDAPTQRLYACAIYIALIAWRLYDWVQLVEDDTSSLKLFIKWIAIDLVFLFGLPELRIPWLEISQPVVITAFFFHAVFDWMLMFNIPVPWASWLLGLMKAFFYDKEMSISEQYVKVSNILQNTSLISGRQIINILPEGTAVLNPEGASFCLGGDRNVVSIPIHFNATVPIEVELIRIDLNTNEEEVLKLSRSQIREIDRQTKRQSSETDSGVVKYDYPTKKPGAYRLGKVLDEYKLEVQRQTQNTFVVPCPKARVALSPSSERCLGDLSDLSLEVEGTPPLKIVYSRTINGKDHSFHFQSLQPDGFSSPLHGSLRTSSLILPEAEDISWARAQKVTVGLNESMNVGGDWQYSVDEVHDAFGNVAKYLSPADDPELRPKPKHLAQNFLVKERPRARLRGCDLRNPLRVAKGKATELPVAFDIAGRRLDNTAHTLTWHFSPIDTLTKSGDHGDVVSPGIYQARNAQDTPSISVPGLYTLKSISSGSCEGEIQEPSSCLLLNPLEPELSIRSEEIPDTCGGNSIGLRVDFDLIGTPPFVIRYEVVSDGEPPKIASFNINGMRHQAEFIPRTAGHHKYTFKAIDDSIYRGLKLSGSDMVLETTVKPAASAYINHPTGKMSACLEEEVEVEINMSGEAPFTLEWALVHDGRKKQHKITDIHTTPYKVKTEALSQGGEYSIALTSIQDKSGCRNFLQDELKISVRHQRPRAAFGLIDGKWKTTVVEGSKVKLPVRLTGEGPWKVAYRNIQDGARDIERTLNTDNDFLTVQSRGTYEIIHVSDNQCRGAVDSKAATFEIDWFPRPELAIVQTESITQNQGNYIKQDACEGDIDGFEISFKGRAPYHVEYEVRHKPSQGSGSLNRKEFDAGLGKAAIQMDTTKAGLYTYTFSALADNLYNSDKKNFAPIALVQRVNAKPSASFVKPGQSFKYCMLESETDDTIPIALTGIAPFSVEIEIKHQSGSVPETYNIPSINSNTYGIQIPRQHLRLGTQHVRIRNVRDSRGCQQKTDINGPSVQVTLYDAPAIYPLESRTDYCVGERIAYTLSGTPPFEVLYTFNGAQRKAKSATTDFRRIAETPGEFEIVSISDKASECRAAVNIVKNIHPLPSAMMSKGKNARVDIHEGGEVEILVEFGGTPPFEFTWTRSTIPKRKGEKIEVLETRHDVSYEHSKVIRASQEGAYDVVAIKDKYCATSKLQNEQKEGGGQKLLQY